MKKFNNMKDYEKFIIDEFDCEGFTKYEWEDFNKFVDNNKYVVLDICSDIDVDDNVIIMNGKWYWIVERYEGMRFCEIENDDIEYIKNEMKNYEE